MKLDFIPLDKLIVAKANMRHGKQPDLSDILPTIRARGVLQSLIVRPHGQTDLFEILAGSRRYRASLIVADERRASGDPEPVMLPWPHNQLGSAVGPRVADQCLQPGAA